MSSWKAPGSAESGSGVLTSAMVVRVILPGSPPAKGDTALKPVPIEVRVNPTDMPSKKEAVVRERRACHKDI